MLEILVIIFSAFVAILPSIIYLAIVISLIIFAWPVILTLLLITLAIIVITLIGWGISNIIRDREANEAVSKIYAAADIAKQMREDAEEKKKAEEQQERLKTQQLEMRKEILLLEVELSKEFELAALNEEQEDENLDNQEKLKEQLQQIREEEIGLCGISTTIQADKISLSNTMLTLFIFIMVHILLIVATGNDFSTQDIVTYVSSSNLFQQLNYFR